MSDPLDRELRDAIEPLMGDPAATWARVMGSLPAPRLRPLWPLVATATAAGLALGWVAALLTREPQPKGLPTDQIAVVKQEPARVVARMGKTWVESDRGPRALMVGDTMAVEAILGTSDESRLFMTLANDVELRLNADSRLAIDTDRSVTLAAGQLFVGQRGEGKSFVVVTGDLDVHCDRADFEVTTTKTGTEVVALEGHVRVATLGGDERALGSLQRVELRNGELGEVQSAGSRWGYVAWQIDALAACADRREEAFGYAYELVRALGDPAAEAAAERSLRTIGALGAGALGMFASGFPDAPTELRRRCWTILADVADARSLPYLLTAITSEDAEVRVAAVRAIERVTAMPSGHDEKFWRDAPYAQRFDVVDAWRRRLRDF